MKHTFAVCSKCGKANRAVIGSEKPAVCGSCATPLPLHGGVVDSDGEHFWTLMQKSPIPVVVDFWAGWCGPCRAFAPTFERASLKYAGQFVFAKLNTELHSGIPAQLGIKGIPTMIVFHRGQEIARQSGALPAEHFEHWLSSLQVKA